MLLVKIGDKSLIKILHDGRELSREGRFKRDKRLTEALPRRHRGVTERQTAKGRKRQRDPGRKQTILEYPGDGGIEWARYYQPIGELKHNEDG